MELGVFAKTFPGNDPLTVMKAAREAGFSAVHYNFSCSGLPAMPDHVDDQTLNAIVQAAKETGVSIAGLSGTYNMAHPDPEIRQDGARRLRTVIAAAKAIGAPIVTLCTGSRDETDQWQHHPDNNSDAAWADMRRSMEDALQAAEDHGVDLGVEPEMANVVSDSQQAVRLLQELESDRLKIVLDPANLFEKADDVTRRLLFEDAVAQLTPHIAMAHAKDRAADGSFVAAGAGVVDFGHFIGLLRRTGFDGPLVAHGCSAKEAPDVAARLLPLLERS